MPSAGDGTPLSLRPFPVPSKNPSNVYDFLQRVNTTQVGGFRALSEAKLRDELAKKNRQDGEEQDDDDEFSSEDEADAAPDITTAREEILQDLHAALFNAGTTMDFLSLLLSKHNPTQATLTLSKQTRDLLGIGTLMSDRLEEKSTDEAKVKEQETVSQGWTLLEVNKTRDAAQEACAFLQQEVEAESKYWEDVAGVQGSGWAICKMPREAHSLGVRFGFSESSADFQSTGLAPMRRGDDGSVQLDMGQLGGVSERIMVTYEQSGTVLGRSSIGAQPGPNAPLEARVLEARNTLFAQELWFELGRESRTLGAYEVRMQGSSLICKLDHQEDLNVRIELVSLDHAPSPDDSLPENHVAESISIGLHILLSFSHRQSEMRRSQPRQPGLPRKPQNETQALLRPIIARSVYNQSIAHTMRFVGALTQSLTKAGLEATFTLRTPEPPTISEAGSKNPSAHSVAGSVIQQLIKVQPFRVNLAVLPGASLIIEALTFSMPAIATLYKVQTPAGSMFQSICPPFRDGYPDMPSLIDYLVTATTQVVTSHLLAQAPKGDWQKTLARNAIRHVETDDWEIRVDIAEDEHKELPKILLSSVTLKGSDIDGSTSFKWAGFEETESSMTLMEAFQKITTAADR